MPISIIGTLCQYVNYALYVNYWHFMSNFANLKDWQSPPSPQTPGARALSYALGEYKGFMNGWLY